MKKISLQLFSFVLLLLPNFAFSQVAYSQCISVFINGPEAEILRNKIVLLSEEVTPYMFSLNRNATAPEKKALEKFIQQRDDCFKKQGGLFKLSENSNDIYIQLKDGLITFSAFALELLKRDLALKQYIENSKTEKPAPPQVLNLSCLFESGPVVGTEIQYQINESAKTLWSNLGSPPSDINFGPTEINFKQGDLNGKISRNTGRFSLTLSNKTHGGKCELITERKF
jgi:hypothetical protein